MYGLPNNVLGVPVIPVCISPELGVEELDHMCLLS